MTPSWIHNPSKALDRSFEQQARDRQQRLTKPPGSLGRLEELCIWLAARQGRACPRVDAPHITIFAGDHGVARHGVSAFPPEVTGQMLANFAAGGAAICVLAREIGAALEVVDVGTLLETHPETVVVDRIARGSADMTAAPALSRAELEHALAAGRRATLRALEAGADLLILGEMGIANTTAATAVGAVLTGGDIAGLAGPGTGLDRGGVTHKARIVERAIAHHELGPNSDPLDVLARVGGHELAALTGAYLSAAEYGLAVLVDGFIGTASALVASRVRPDVGGWMLVSHASAEPGHRSFIDALGQAPTLDLGMRLGEASGAATLVALLHLACALHGSMATFEEAGVADGS